MSDSLKLALDDELFEWVREESARRHCTMASMVRQLIVAEKLRQKKDTEKETASVLYLPSPKPG